MLVQAIDTYARGGRHLAGFASLLRRYQLRAAAGERRRDRGDDRPKLHVAFTIDTIPYKQTLVRGKDLARKTTTAATRVSALGIAFVTESSPNELAMDIPIAARAP